MNEIATKVQNILLYHSTSLMELQISNTNDEV